MKDEDISLTIYKEELEKYMSYLNTKEKWETVKYSKKEINKAGKIIAQNSCTEEERNEALEILNNWRASHAYPLQVIASNLRRSNKKALVVQRLKRLESIVGKLARFENMNLYRMQDLGGCRVIVSSLEEVYQAVDRYKSSRVRHILKREDDYIKNPKESGYRCYHLVYEFQSDKKETYNKNMLIEIQFRTSMQHMWATAVEMMGIYTKSALKASIGDADTLKFFSLVSSIFAILEESNKVPGTPTSPIDLIKEIKDIDSRYNIVSRLSALSVAIEHMSSVEGRKNTKKSGYFILQLNYKRKSVHITAFKPSEVEFATNVYDRIEKEAGKNIDAVLVSASSFEALKLAYPNYFTDISEFVGTMRKILADDFLEDLAVSVSEIIENQ